MQGSKSVVFFEFSPPSQVEFYHEDLVLIVVTEDENKYELRIPAKARVFTDKI